MWDHNPEKDIFKDGPIALEHSEAKLLVDEARDIDHATKIPLPLLALERFQM